MEAPVIRCEVDRSAAYHAPVQECGLRLRLFLFGLAEGYRLALRVVRERMLNNRLELVVLEILLAQVGSLFENEHAEASRGELSCQYPARSSGADDGEVHLFVRAEFAHPPDHGSTFLRAAFCSSRYWAS